MIDGQLRSKRDEFWDTVFVFEGRKEIWDVFKVVVYAVEVNDYELVQVILDGVSIILFYGERVGQGFFFYWREGVISVIQGRGEFVVSRLYIRRFFLSWWVVEVVVYLFVQVVFFERGSRVGYKGKLDSYCLFYVGIERY